MFGQHGLDADRRAAFLAGYGASSDLVERARWWEPVLLLGSALWWLDRSIVEATRRLDRFDEAAKIAT